MNRLSLITTHLMYPLLLGLGALGSTGCDYLEKKANEKLQEELKKETKERLGDDEKAAKDGDSTEAPSDGPVWTDAVTGKKVKMSRLKIDGGGLSGLSMLAPEGAQVKASLGGRGMDVSQFQNGFAVWVTEDPTVTVELMKTAAQAKYGKDSKIEDGNRSLIVGGTSALGDPFYAYMGFFKAAGKIYRCETEAAFAGSTKAHAEGIGKACESLEIDGKPIAEAVQDSQPTDDKADKGTASTVPATTRPGKSAGAAPKKAACKCAKSDLLCNMRCNAH